MNKLNKKILMSGVEHFAVEELNPYSFSDNQPSLVEAKQEYSELQAIFEQAGIEITHVGAPEGCQDGIYTANWALCLGRTALMANLPNMRQAETPYATQQLKNLGYEIETLPHSIKFSGQGDALVCGNKIFAGYGYRTDLDAHEFIKKLTAKEVISLQTVPAMNESGQPIINNVTGWPDSFFYDIDLALAVINDNLVAWCPEAFTPASQELMKDVDVQKIEVSLEEAVGGFACNLLSTGETVVMSDQAPELEQQLRNEGFKVVTPKMNELSKGGGYIRCTTLTLSN